MDNDTHPLPDCAELDSPAIKDLRTAYGGQLPRYPQTGWFELCYRDIEGNDYCARCADGCARTLPLAGVGAVVLRTEDLLVCHVCGAILRERIEPDSWFFR